MSRGRPRKFDSDSALDAAMTVFWEKGFEATTIEDLTSAMGINRPSLYAAFGNKESLFLKALERYAQGPAAHVAKAMTQPRIRDAISDLLRFTVDLSHGKSHPQGCLIVQSALPCGSGTDLVRRSIEAAREAGFKRIRMRLERAKKEGELPGDTDCAALARYLMALMHGLAVQAAQGATRTQLQSVVNVALRFLPI